MNGLANESSLYLKQHANNPVDWQPWGEAACATARRLDRPIFLSIGYSACHWCHVMEHESFEDAATAALMNANFVCIKVDREERPDLDTIYMTALHLMTREGGGWPLSVWLTPDLHPFYAGTYFPPDGRYGTQRPAFPQLLTAIAEAWKSRREEITQRSRDVVEYLAQVDRAEADDPAPLSAELLRNARNRLQQIFDTTHGGFGTPPKFPHAIDLRLLLRFANRDDAQALHMVRFTLDQMAQGGIYDQIGGGFHRYSVDLRWLVPHFEKMLYDNALMLRAYLELYQTTRDENAARIAREICDYVIREMTSPEGGFYSTRDADSEGEEGKFYVWSKAEIQSLLDPADAAIVTKVYQVTSGGNFEGHNILNRGDSYAKLATQLEMGEADLLATLARAKATLYAERDKRIHPGRDEKILTAWNGLMIAALAQAGAILNEPRYTATATRAAEFVETHLTHTEGKLLRTCGIGIPGKLNGYLEDYAFLAEGYFELFLATFEPRWLKRSIELAARIMASFADAERGGFYFTSHDHEALITRTKETFDGSTPSGNAIAVGVLARLGLVAGNGDWIVFATRSLQAFRGMMADSPTGCGQMILNLDDHLAAKRELVFLSVGSDDGLASLIGRLRQEYSPYRTIFHATNLQATELSEIPLYRDRPSVNGEPTLYLCEGMTCQAPIVGIVAIEKALFA